MNKLGISLLTLGFAGTALATGKSDYHNFKPDKFNQNKAYSDSFSKSNASVSGVKAISRGGKAIAHGGNIESGAIKNKVAGGIGQGGIGIGGIGQGGNIQPGAVQNRFQEGDTHSTVLIPATLPPVIPSNIWWQCGGNFGGGGSDGKNSGNVLFPWTYDDCLVHLNSKRMEELNKPKTACQIMVNEYDEIKVAMDQMGEECKTGTSVAVAVPTNQVVPVATPALDQWWEEKNKEIDQKLDNAQRHGVMK